MMQGSIFPARFSLRLQALPLVQPRGGLGAELHQPPRAQDPALEAVELQLQLERGLLGGKIVFFFLSVALTPRGFLGGAFAPSTPNTPSVRRGECH